MRRPALRGRDRGVPRWQTGEVGHGVRDVPRPRGGMGEVPIDEGARDAADRDGVTRCRIVVEERVPPVTLAARRKDVAHHLARHERKNFASAIAAAPRSTPKTPTTRRLLVEPLPTRASSSRTARRRVRLRLCGAVYFRPSASTMTIAA